MLDSRRLIVRAASPASPSASRTTPAPRRGARCAVMKASTSAVVTSAGSLATTPKNTFRSKAVASSVFGRARAATRSR
jgi:di/tricarboxylate transporter